jgi:RHH-type transcriptional regulator, proline utilization regulon repressor / proline dehydrogenase / delta 1-pyrroline-5-carboxylate dehydrogenase
MAELPSFTNEPVLELRRAAVRAQLPAALKALDARLPLQVPVLVGGDAATAGAGGLFDSTDPGTPDRVVAHARAATSAEIAAALAAARGAQPAWAATGARTRAAALIGAAAVLRSRRVELAALAVRECAKPWREADADVCEAIDFLEYYAREAIALEQQPALIQPPGERNALEYRPRGIAAVISPWNFPFAIPCGMTAAALATGNAALLKPAEQSPTCAHELVKALHAGGVPKGVLALLPGEGDVGAALVESPEVHVIAFTGSLAVGLEINAAAARQAPGQRHFKRVVAELGGKNCVIVDADADLDDAIPAIVDSAFAFAGQKCSAASRVLVHEAIAEALIERLAGAAAVLEVGQAEHLGTEVPPVIERSAQERVLELGALAAGQGRIVARARAPRTAGWFCPPTVAADLPADSELLTREVFGPLLTVERVKSVEDACDRVDELGYALTGGLFARAPSTVAHVRRRSPVGNLYINRGITGAIVGRQPFGGNRLSGMGVKAGGPGYLSQFVEARVVSENTVRHGLVV